MSILTKYYEMCQISARVTYEVTPELRRVVKMIVPSLEMASVAI